MRAALPDLLGALPDEAASLLGIFSDDFAAGDSSGFDLVDGCDSGRGAGTFAFSCLEIFCSSGRFVKGSGVLISAIAAAALPRAAAVPLAVLAAR